MEAVVFFAAGAMALGGAVGVVALRNPFHSVLAVVVNLIALAVLFLLLQAEFVAAVQIVVYVGAVMVLYVFVAAYVGGADEPITPHDASLKVLGPIFAAALLVELTIAILGTGLSIIDTQGATLKASFGSPAQIGELFLTRFLLPFEIASFLLLVAAVGAVVLARRQRLAEATGTGSEAEGDVSGKSPAEIEPPGSESTEPGTGASDEGGAKS